MNQETTRALSNVFQSQWETSWALVGRLECIQPRNVNIKLKYVEITKHKHGQIENIISLAVFGIKSL